MVQIGGPGPDNHPAATHKIVYGDFHFTYWNENDGKIGRSFRFDTRNSTEKLGMVSVIIDAKKPLIVRHKLL